MNYSNVLTQCLFQEQSQAISACVPCSAQNDAHTTSQANGCSRVDLADVEHSGAWASDGWEDEDGGGGDVAGDLEEACLNAGGDERLVLTAVGDA